MTDEPRSARCGATTARYTEPARVVDGGLRVGGGWRILVCRVMAALDAASMTMRAAPMGAWGGREGGVAADLGARHTWRLSLRSAGTSEARVTLASRIFNQAIQAVPIRESCLLP